MKALWLTKNSLLWYILDLAALALVIGSLIALISAVRAKRGNGTLVPSWINTALSFLLFIVMMDCARYAYLSEPDLRYRAFQLNLFELPWLLYAGLEAVLALVTFLLLRNDLRYRRSHLTPDAVREAVDLLPEGICVSAPDGTVLLSNLQMNTLCRALTGGTLSDAVRFHGQVEAAGEKQNDETLVRTPDGKVRSFSGKQLTVNGKTYDLLTAADMTARYRITEELRDKNERLQDIQRRMKQVSDLSGDMFIAQEEAAARAALHNQLGQVLLMGRHCLEHPDSTDAEMVRMTTKEMNRFLLREAEAPAAGNAAGMDGDLLQEALLMVRSIGVQADIRGELPRDPARRVLLAHTVQECAANTVKHAEGDRLGITVSGDTVRITNNGKPPKGPVTESGGLLALRRSVEEAGGSMSVESSPAFVLEIRFPETP